MYISVDEGDGVGSVIEGYKYTGIDGSVGKVILFSANLLCIKDDANEYYIYKHDVPKLIKALKAAIGEQ